MMNLLFGIELSVEPHCAKPALPVPVAGFHGRNSIRLGLYDNSRCLGCSKWLTLSDRSSQKPNLQQCDQLPIPAFSTDIFMLLAVNMPGVIRLLSDPTPILTAPND